MKKFFKRKFKASYTVEAAAVVPIVVIIAVIMTLSYRMISLDSVMQLAKEEANIMFSTKMMRFQYSGMIDDYVTAPEGGIGISDSDMAQIDFFFSKEDLWTHKDYSVLGGDVVNNAKNYSDKYGVEAFKQGFVEVYKNCDQYGCDYEKLKALYNSNRILVSKKAYGKKDYEKIFSYIFEKRVKSNIKAYEDSKFTSLVFSSDDIKISNWEFEVSDSLIKYSCILTYEIKVPLPFTSKTAWKKETNVIGYVSRR